LLNPGDITGPAAVDQQQRHDVQLTPMARLAQRLPQNASGDLYVDASCIDCETCRQIAPGVFARHDGAGQSVVRAQPADAAERRRALMALAACPTASIGQAGARDPAAV
jgi:ferredoxin